MTVLTLPLLKKHYEPRFVAETEALAGAIEWVATTAGYEAATHLVLSGILAVSKLETPLWGVHEGATEAHLLTIGYGKVSPEKYVYLAVRYGAAWYVYTGVRKEGAPAGLWRYTGPAYLGELVWE